MLSLSSATGTKLALVFMTLWCCMLEHTASALDVDTIINDQPKKKKRRFVDPDAFQPPYPPLAGIATQ
jgi:hypothetical protein